MLNVVGPINHRIDKLEKSHITEITVEVFITAVNQLKFGKNDGFYLLIILKMESVGCMSYCVCCLIH